MVCLLLPTVLLYAVHCKLSAVERASACRGLSTFSCLYRNRFMLIFKIKLLIQIYQIQGPGCEIAFSASSIIAAWHAFLM